MNSVYFGKATVTYSPNVSEHHSVATQAALRAAELRFHKEIDELPDDMEIVFDNPKRKDPAQKNVFDPDTAYIFKKGSTEGERKQVDVTFRQRNGSTHHYQSKVVNRLMSYYSESVSEYFEKVLQLANAAKQRWDEF